jgi:hypothetical protein
MHTSVHTHVIQSRASAGQLQQALQEQGVPCQVLREALDCRLAPACRWLCGAPLTDEARLIGAIDHTVEVLNKTRHAFKSKDLAQLRGSLERLLAQLAVAAQ